MSNTYLTTAFEVSAKPEELDRLVALVGLIDRLEDDRRKEDPEVPAILAEAFPQIVNNDDLGSALTCLLEARIEGPISVLMRRSTPTLLDVSGRNSPDVDLLGACIRITCPSALPMGFTFAVVSDRPEIDPCGGGYIVISRYGVDGMNAQARMEAEIHALRHEKPLTQVQQAAFDAYDDNGEFAMIADGAHEHRLKTMIKDGTLGDTLPLFILNEASDAGEDFEEAADMMDRAAEQLTKVGEALRERAEDEA